VIRCVVMNMDMIDVRRGRRGGWLRHEMRRGGVGGGGMGSKWYGWLKARRR